MNDAANDQPGVPPDASDGPDIESIVADLEASVEQRRRDGLYPPTLEEDLDAHFRRIMAFRPVAVGEPLAAARAALERLPRLPPLDDSGLPATSGWPGGAAAHRVVARVVHRQTEEVRQQVQRALDQVQVTIDALASACDVLARALADGSAHAHPEMLGQLDALVEQLAEYERASPDTAVSVPDLHRRVDRLERAELRRNAPSWYSTAAWEAEQDSLHPVRREIRHLVTQAVDAEAAVAHLWCGTGVLLAGLGTGAMGVDDDEEMAAMAQSHGFRVDYGDPVEWLAGLVEQNLDAVVITDVVRTAAADLARIVPLSLLVLGPEGSLLIGGADGAHRPPDGPAADPLFLRFLVQQAGYGTSAVEAVEAPVGPPGWLLRARR